MFDLTCLELSKAFDVDSYTKIRDMNWMVGLLDRRKTGWTIIES